MQVKKFYIRVLAILMAVTIAVTTPLSDFADIKGMKQTHAVAPTLITLGGLFGAIAGAYGLYVATDKLADYAENWFNWTADNATDARTDLQKIKDGVTSYVITKAVTNSVADYLSTLDVENVSSNVVGKATNWNSLPDTVYTTSFMDYFGNTIRSDYEFPVLVLYSDTGINGDTASSGYYKVFYVNPKYAATPWGGLYTYSNFKELYSNANADHKLWLTINKSGYEQIVFNAFNSLGMPLGYSGQTNNSQSYYSFIHFDEFYYTQGHWLKNRAGSTYDYLFPSLDNYRIKTLVPLYRTTYTDIPKAEDMDSVLSNTFLTKQIVIDYKTHGNNALDNADALEGAEVTQAQLEAIQQAVEKEYSNVIQFPNSDGDNEEEPDTQALANAITLAVLSTLQNMGYIKNPTDEPSGENVKEQLGKIEIAVDGMTDAMAQNNRLLENVFDAVQGLASNIGNAVSVAFQNALDALFVPDTEAVENLTNDFFDKFPWTHTLFDYTDDIKKAFLSSEPPKIYIHFQDSKDSKYHSIGTQLAFDASWYAPYKPTGDMILSVFIYALFLWRLFKNIPNIMSGLGMMTEQPIRFEDNMVKNGKG